MENKIYGAIVATMKDIGAIGKNDSNDFDRYKYRGIDAVYNALQPAMVKNGIFVIPELMEIEQSDRVSRKGDQMIHSRVTVKYTFFADDGSSVIAIVPGEAMDRSDKSVNKAMTAAYKYACFQTFTIPTEDFSDADGESPEAGEKISGTTKKSSQGSQKSSKAKTNRDLLVEYIRQTGRNMKDVAKEYSLSGNTDQERFGEVLLYLSDIDRQNAEETAVQ